MDASTGFATPNFENHAIPCRTCGAKAVSIYRSFKNCAKCRKANALKKTQAAARRQFRETVMMARRKEMMEQWDTERDGEGERDGNRMTSDADGSEDSGFHSTTMATTTTTPLGASSTNNAPSAAASSSPCPSSPLLDAKTLKAKARPKPKARRSSGKMVYTPLGVLEGSKKANAIKATQIALRRHVNAVMTDPPLFGEYDEEEYGTEYTSGEQLHKVLSTKAIRCHQAGTRLKFRASYAIVVEQANVDAEKTKERVTLAYRTLSKLPGLHFESEKATLHCEDEGYVVTAKCGCGPYTTPATPSASASASSSGKLKKTSSIDLYFNRLSSSHPPSQSQVTPCEGRVLVQIVDDGSHPFLAAQRISVRVEHPRND